jgi:hypothetical protein
MDTITKGNAVTTRYEIQKMKEIELICKSETDPAKLIKRVLDVVADAEVPNLALLLIRSVCKRAYGEVNGAKQLNIEDTAWFVNDITEEYHSIFNQ